MRPCKSYGATRPTDQRLFLLLLAPTHQKEPAAAFNLCPNGGFPAAVDTRSIKFLSTGSGSFHETQLLVYFRSAAESAGPQLQPLTTQSCHPSWPACKWYPPSCPLQQPSGCITCTLAKQAACTSMQPSCMRQPGCA